MVVRAGRLSILLQGSFDRRVAEYPGGIFHIQTPPGYHEETETLEPIAPPPDAAPRPPTAP